MYFFSADEHYGHAEMLKYRPFETVEQMDQALIDNHNSVIGKDGTCVHVGDFTLVKDSTFAHTIIKKLNGNHIFVKGSHDYWVDRDPACLDYMPIDYLWQKTLKYPNKKRYFISACHYPMRSWPRSHYANSWQLYGHHHGNLSPYGLQMDVGLDTNNLFPYSFDQIIDIMEPREALYNLALPVFDNNYKDTWDWLTTGSESLGGAIPVDFIRAPGGLDAAKDLLIRFSQKFYL